MPTNIKVDCTSSYSKRAAASWHMDGARFHVWFNLDTKELDREGLIYKNPLEGTDRNSPSHFNTRKLDGTLPTNAKIIKQVFAEIDSKSLIAAALEVEAEKERKTQEANAAYKREELAKAVALELLANLEFAAKLLQPLLGSTAQVEHMQAVIKKAKGE